MNTRADDQPWSQDTVDPMVQMTHELDDLSNNIFNLDNFDLDALPNIDENFGAPMQHSQPGTNSNSPFDDTFGGLGIPPGTLAQDFGGHDGFGIPTTVGGQQQFVPQTGLPSGSMQFGADPMFQTSIPQQYQSQQFGFPPQQQNYFPGHHVPPTPNSFDLHGESGRFMQQQVDAQQRAMLEQQYQMRKNEQIQFTPMASPSGTPQFHMNPEYTVPGAYFSPLTSPALHAQNSAQMHPQFQQHQQGYYTNSSTAPSSAAPSPLDPNGDVEMGGDGMTLPEPAAAPPKKSTRKKVATPRSLAMSKMKQSPIQKAQKRKSTLSSLVSTSKDATLQSDQRSAKLAPNSAPLQVPRAFESSENDSVSPEALSDALMGPPPKPASLMSKSPAINGLQQQQQGTNGGSGPAATPNSLLSTKTSQHPPNGQSGSADSTQDSGQLSLDDFQLPEAASQPAEHTSHRPSLSQINTQIPPTGSNEQTPRLPARKTPKLNPSSTPSSARPFSATASPSVAMSPMTASTPAALLKEKGQDAVSGRGRSGTSSRKRGSASASNSNLASPAIRPRISPSIKPLLPEGTTLNSPTHALLLASKSNYQNLLEGNRLPGVNYPDSLSTGLTSKRTSHKVAEQGRRNRINDALKEMQSLIPSSKPDGGGGGEEDSPEVDADGKETKESIAKSNSSKAATVESANKYLRVLKENDGAQKAAILALRKELDDLRRLLLVDKPRPEELPDKSRRVDSAAEGEKSSDAMDSSPDLPAKKTSSSSFSSEAALEVQAEKAS